MSYIKPDAEYMLINAASKTALDCGGNVSQGAQVKGWSLNINLGAEGANNQVWKTKLISTDDKRYSWYTLTARRTGFNLESPLGSPPDGTKLVTNSPNKTERQEWAFLPVSTAAVNGYPTYVLANHSAYTSDGNWHAMDMIGGSPNDGTEIGVFTQTVKPGNNQNQVWMLVKID